MPQCTNCPVCNAVVVLPTNSHYVVCTAVDHQCARYNICRYTTRYIEEKVCSACGKWAKTVGLHVYKAGNWVGTKQAHHWQLGKNGKGEYI